MTKILRNCLSLRSSGFTMWCDYMGCETYAWLGILLLTMVWCPCSLRDDILRPHLFIFHMVMSITLDEVPCLLHLSFKGRLLDHNNIIIDEALDMMVTYLGVYPWSYVPTYTKDMPHASTFVPIRRNNATKPFRVYLNRLVAENIHFQACTDHRQMRPLDDITFYF